MRWYVPGCTSSKINDPWLFVWPAVFSSVALLTRVTLAPAMDAPELSSTVTLTLPLIVWPYAHRLATYSKPRERVNLIGTPNREDLIEGQIIVIGLAFKIVSTNPFEKCLFGGLAGAIHCSREEYPKIDRIIRRG
jgi:hypothetical protein